MGRFWRRALTAAALACLAGCAALAEETIPMRIYAPETAISEQTAQRLIRLLGSAMPQGEWTLVQEGDLRALVLADNAPQLAICGPGEAMPWAREGLLLPLDGQIADTARMQSQVLDPCTHAGHLYMAPLLARHRQMAANRQLLERGQFGYLLDPLAHPVWMPSELQQVLEEFALRDQPAMDIWPALGEGGEAIEALVQAIYGGSLLSEDGQTVTADTGELRSGLAWLADMVECGMIGWVQDRETALTRFLRGETALFLGWTDKDAARVRQDKPELALLPYPSALGVPVRSFALTGVCAFDTGGSEQRTLAVQAVSLLCEDAKAQMALGSRAIYQDDAFWLACLEADARGATLRSLFAAAIDAVVAGERTPKAALSIVQAAMDAAN
ncbi:MAG: extracellular solute-binding protein [Candidatus Ventricola sp.]